MPKVLVVCELDTTNLPPYDDLREPGCMQNLRDFFASTLHAAHENKTTALSRGDSESVKQYDYDIALAKRFLKSLRIFNIFDQQSEAIEFEQVLEIALELFPELTKAQCEEVIWMNTTYPFRTDESAVAKTELFRQQLQKIREYFDTHNKFPNGILI